MDVKNRIIDLFASSTVTQGTLSILVVGGWLYLMIAQIPVPTAMDITVGIVVGFFFGTKSQQTFNQMVSRDKASHGYLPPES